MSIQSSRFSRLRLKRKTIIAIAIISVAAFSLGVYANRVVVQQVSSLGGNHVGVPAPELQILNSFWNVNLNASTITQVVLNLTTVGLSSTASGFKLYQVFVQVSCLNPPNIQFTCSTGTSSIILPTNLNGASTILPVSLSRPIDPETTEIDDLSFIVTGRPVSTPTLIGVPVTATPALNSSGMASVSFTLTSANGFSGTVMLNPQPLPPGITMTATGISAGNIPITAGGTVVDQWIISANPSLTGDQLICLSFNDSTSLNSRLGTVCIWLLGSIPSFGKPNSLPNLYFPNCPVDFTTSNLCLGSTAGTLVFQVGNNGQADAKSFDVAVTQGCSTPPSFTCTVTLHVNGLGVGARVTLSTLNTCAAEFCSLTITIDPTNAITEITKTDNVYRDIITPSCCPNHP